MKHQTKENRGHASFDCRFEVKSVSEKGSFTGYGSVFGNVDLGYDIVEPGAFAKSLAKIKDSGAKVPILWQHRSGEPIGVYTSIKEDSYGLFMEGQLLIDDVQRSKEAYALLKAGAISGMSIGYDPIDYVHDAKAGVRRLKELGLLETSLVTFPMNEAARVTVVKSALSEQLKAGNLPSLSEFEDLLREAGFSRTQAKTVAGHGLRYLLDRRDAETQPLAETAEIVGLLRSFSKTI